MPQNTSGLKDLQHRLFGKILAALSVRGGWLLAEWLDPGDAAVVLYGNERNCTHLHDTLTRIGYTEERFVELLEGYGTLHTQPVIRGRDATGHLADTEHNSSYAHAWRDWGYPSFYSLRSRFLYSSRSLYLVRLGNLSR